MTSTSLLALVQSEVSSHKATSSPEAPSNMSPVVGSWRCIHHLIMHQEIKSASASKKEIKITKFLLNYLFVINYSVKLYGVCILKYFDKLILNRKFTLEANIWPSVFNMMSCLCYWRLNRFKPTKSLAQLKQFIFSIDIGLYDSVSLKFWDRCGRDHMVVGFMTSLTGHNYEQFRWYLHLIINLTKLMKLITCSYFRLNTNIPFES